MLKFNVRLPQTLSGWLSWQIRLLSIQFLLGMAINLIGLPSEVHGATRTIVLIILALHILAAISLFTISIILIKLSRPFGPSARRFAMLGTGGIIVAMLCGMLTLMAPFGNLWSYFMAVAFLAIFGFYGRLHPIISRPKHSSRT